MDAEPHTHTPKLSREFQYTQAGDHILIYGDTRVRVCGEWRTPTEKDVRRALAKAIKQHDRGSLKAAAEATKQHKAYDVIRDFEKAKAEHRMTNSSEKVWGEELLRK